jgi:hypothetical protein
MKKRCLLILILALFTIGLSACQQPPAVGQPKTESATVTAAMPAQPPAADTQPAPDTAVPTLAPTIAPTLPPTETLAATESLTQVSPTSTAEPATAAAPTAALSEAPAATQAVSSSDAELPVEGLWNGIGSNLLITFNIIHQNGQVFISDMSVLWLGPSICTVDLRTPGSTAINPEKFTRHAETDLMHYDLNGRMKTPEMIVGDITVHAVDCNERKIDWIAQPKDSSAQPTATQAAVLGVWHGSGPSNAAIDFELSNQGETLAVNNFVIEWDNVCQGKPGHIVFNSRESFPQSPGANLHSTSFAIDYERVEQIGKTNYHIEGRLNDPNTIEGTLNYSDAICGATNIAWLAVPKAGTTPGP